MKHLYQDSEPSYGASAMKPKMPLDLTKTPEERLALLEKRVQELERTLSETLALLAGKY